MFDIFEEVLEVGTSLTIGSLVGNEAKKITKAATGDDLIASIVGLGVGIGSADLVLDLFDSED